MSKKWRKLKTKFGNTTSEADIVQEGLDKLESYYARLDDVPAYVIAMSTCTPCLYVCILILSVLVLNPHIKVSYYKETAPHKVAWARDLLKKTVCCIILFTHSKTDCLQLRPYFYKRTAQLHQAQQSALNVQQPQNITIQPTQGARPRVAASRLAALLKDDADTPDAPRVVLPTTLDDKINEYLCEPLSTGTSSLVYWQVCW